MILFNIKRILSNIKDNVKSSFIMVNLTSKRDSSDEPPSELLKRIKEEGARCRVLISKLVEVERPLENRKL